MSAQQAPFRSPMQLTFVRHPSSEAWESPVAFPKLSRDGEWGCLREIRSTKSVSDSYLHSADFAVLLAMKSIISATGKLRISYGVRSLFAARQVPHMHIFPRFPAPKKGVRNLWWLLWQAAPSPHCGPDPRLCNGPVRVAVADKNSYLFRICSGRTGSDFSYENNNFSYAESATSATGFAGCAHSPHPHPAQPLALLLTLPLLESNRLSTPLMNCRLGGCHGLP